MFACEQTRAGTVAILTGWDQRFFDAFGARDTSMVASLRHISLCTKVLPTFAIVSLATGNQQSEHASVRI